MGGFSFGSGSDRVLLEDKTYIEFEGDSVIQEINSFSIELWLWPLEDEIPAKDTRILEIDPNGRKNDIKVYISEDCKCILVEQEGHSSSILTEAVDNLAIPAFLGLSFAEVEDNMDINISFQGVSKTGQFSKENLNTKKIRIQIGNDLLMYAAKVEMYYG